MKLFNRVRMGKQFMLTAIGVAAVLGLHINSYGQFKKPPSGGFTETLSCQIYSDQEINYNATAAQLTSTKRGGSSGALYFYRWEKSLDEVTWENLTGSGTTFDPGALTVTTYYRLTISGNGSSATSNTVTITVYPALTCSISPATQTISPGSSPATMSAVVTGGSGTYSYQWQSSPDNINWTNQVTTSTYKPGALSTNQFYRVTAISNGASAAGTASVNISFSASLSISSSTPSGNGSINVLNCTTSGSSGTLSYKWYYSINGGSTYELISGATSATYTTGEVTASTMYYVVVSSGGTTSNSNTVSIVVPTAPVITSNFGTVCNGGIATFTASGGSGSYRWYNASGTQLGTGTTYSTGSGGTYYAVSYTDFGVSPHSNHITVTALNKPAVSSISGATVCVLGSAAQFANSFSGGTWSSSNTSVATINADGVLSGKTAGTTTIKYYASNNCGPSAAWLDITVIPFADIVDTLGTPIADPLVIENISLVQNTVKTTQFRLDTALSAAHTIKNVLALKLAEESDQYIPGDFTATVVVKVEYGHSPLSIYQLESVKLQVSYTKAEGIKYNPLNYFWFNNAEFTRVTVLQVDAPTTVNGQSFDTKQVLRLTNSLAGMRYYQLANNKKPVLAYTAPAATPVPDQLPISWTLPAHTLNNALQLEWAWLQNEMKDSYTVNGVFDAGLLFNASSTRIDLPGGAPAGSYTIPLLYDGAGTLYMRARAVNIMPGGSRSDGPWSDTYTYAFAGHNNNLNWQMNTSFAEDGKRKTVIQYYDGSMRQRQTVTKDNTTGQTIVAETLYDMQGRPAVQILPAPGIHNIIAYTNNLNKFNTQANNTNPADYFDFTTTDLGNYQTAPLSESTGAAKYYSPQNPDAATGYHKNIPVANGYPYAVTRYTPDATGRILRQGGVGDSLRMGSGHETRYFYGTPAQEELDALFGTEVGNYTHYFKNMVQDANGQMSVSYTDMRGRTIATALAGEAPRGMQALNVADASQYTNQAGKLLTRNLLNKATNILKDRSIEAINSILVPFKTNHNFIYQLTQKTLTLPTCSGGTVSYDCKFDLQISVTDESGDTEPIVYNYTNISSISFNETLLLEAGSYSVRKTLTINQQSLAGFIAQYNTPGVGICKTQQQLADSIYAASSAGCDAAPAPLTSSGCLATLGSYDAYLASYAASIGKTVAQLPAGTVNDIKNQYQAQAEFCASLNLNASVTLPNIRKQMLADMTPYSGQYALQSGTGTMHNKYNIFSTGGGSVYTQPFYKYPKTPAGAAGSYYDVFGNADPKAPTLAKEDFETEFANSWATALLPYHPEYKKLKFAEDSLASSFNFIDSVELVTAPFNLVTSDPFFAIASRAADRDSITRYSNTAWKDMNNYSMWQTAYGDALGCKTIAEGNARTTCYNNMPKTQTPTGSSINTGTTTVTLTTAMQAQAWNMYKALYRQAREEMVYRYINVRPGTVDTTDNSNLIAQSFRLYFPYTYVQAAQNAGWQSWYPQAAAGGATATINLADSVARYANRCNSYINAWQTALLNCPELANKDAATRTALLNSITGKLLQVCQNGTDAANPLGASTTRPGTTAGGYSSFEQAIKYVLDSAGIATSQLCNPYSIQYPKPYGKNPPRAAGQQIAVIDDCTCTQWNKLKTEMVNAGQNNNNLQTVNQYLKNQNRDTLTQVLYNGLLQCSPVYNYNTQEDPTCTTITSDKATTLCSTSFTEFNNNLQNNSARSIELWLNPASDTTRSLRFVTPGDQYMCQAALQNGKLWIELYTLSKNSNQSITITASNHFTADVSAITLTDWQHLVIQSGTNLATGTLSVYLNAQLLTRLTNAPPYPIGWGIDFNNGNYRMPEGDITALRHLRLYNREITQPEISANQQSPCRAPEGNLRTSNNPLLLWGRLNAAAGGTDDCAAYSARSSAASPTNTPAPPSPAATTSTNNHPLLQPQPLPAFLTCGYDAGNTQCYSCTDFINLENAFYNLFGKRPVFTGDLSDTAIALNDLFARYINAKTGLTKNWTYYAQQFANAGCPIGGTPAIADAGLKICPDRSPADSPQAAAGSSLLTACQEAGNQATDKANQQYQYNQQQLYSNFTAAYLQACLTAAETFTVADTIKEYHYTLYYYDQAGNLVKTVPPKGVQPNYSSSYLNTVATERNKLLSGAVWTPTTPAHTLVTRYCYNSVNQVVLQKSPDAGSSRYWYDRLARLAASQNNKQKAASQYSYTYYDELGRITEAGQLTSSTALTNAIAKSQSSLQS